MLKVYTLAECENWDRIVRSFFEYDVYWLSGYVKAFQIHGDGQPLLFYYEDKKVRGMNVVLKRDVSEIPYFADKLPKEQYFDFAAPYGYGGWVIEGEERMYLFHAYETWCQNNGIISEFVRFHPIIKNHAVAKESYEIMFLGPTVALELYSPEVIWSNLSSKNRNMIRKAEKSGVMIYSGRCEKLYEEFMKIYNTTMDYDHAKEYYYFQPNFYQSLCRDLPENAQVFYAQKNGEIVAASIILAANGHLSYHLSGSLRDHRNAAPMNLLLYKAALWGCVNGCRTFHLGGGLGAEEDSLFKFKRSFCRKEDLCKFYVGKKIYLQEKYEELVVMRKDRSRSYFPEYRA